MKAARHTYGQPSLIYGGYTIAQMVYSYLWTLFVRWLKGDTIENGLPVFSVD